MQCESRHWPAAAKWICRLCGRNACMVECGLAHQAGSLPCRCYTAAWHLSPDLTQRNIQHHSFTLAYILSRAVSSGWNLLTACSVLFIFIYIRVQHERRYTFIIVWQLMGDTSNICRQPLTCLFCYLATVWFYCLTLHRLHVWHILNLLLAVQGIVATREAKFGRQS